MRLDAARLCLDCEEVHDERECPACGSEAFAFLKRWIRSAAETDRDARTSRPLPGVSAHPAQNPEQLNAWKQIVEGKPAPRRGRLVARGLIGLVAMGLAGWAWTRGKREE